MRRTRSFATCYEIDISDLSEVREELLRGLRRTVFETNGNVQSHFYDDELFIN